MRAFRDTLAHGALRPDWVRSRLASLEAARQ